MYVDLHGLALSGSPGETYVGTGGVWRSRWSNVDPKQHTARLVLDLSEALPARWVPAPDGGCLQVGAPAETCPFTPERPRVESVELVNQPGQSGQLRVRLSGPTEFSVEVSRRPYRLHLSSAGRSRHAAVPKRRGGGDSPQRPGVPPGGPWSAGRDPAGLDHALHRGHRSDRREITLLLRSETLADKRLVIDPGHAGRTPARKAADCARRMSPWR